MRNDLSSLEKALDRFEKTVNISYAGPIPIGFQEDVLESVDKLNNNKLTMGKRISNANIDGRQLDPHSKVDQETSVGTTKDAVDERGRKIEQKVKGLQGEIKKLEDKRDKAHAGGFYELEDSLDDKITILEQRVVLTQMGKSQI